MKDLLQEDEAATVSALLSDSRDSATSRFTFVECVAAVSRARREGRIGRKEEGAAGRSFEKLWAAMTIVEVGPDIALAAADLARKHPLRAADALHLASAVAISSSQDPTVFVCWDTRLREAVRAVGLTLEPPDLAGP